MMAHNLGARIHDIRKNTRRTTEDVVFEFNTRIDRDIILNLDVIPNHHVRSHMDILAENTALTNPGP
jgi:hypothetical protein